MFRLRAFLLVLTVVLVGLGIAAGHFASSGGSRGGGGSVAPTPSPVTGVFPLRTEAGKRYLVDASGEPFLLHGDSAWSMVSRLSREDAELYLEDRRRKGFNTVLVNILDNKSMPRNFYGDAAFAGALAPGGVVDYGTPNEAYFAHVDFVIQKAFEKGILVLLVPSYLGYDGDSTGSQGWYHPEMKNNGTHKMYEYGRYLGRRYAGFSNILWVNGGDFDPPDKALVTEIVRGIREFATHLHTVHCRPERSALDNWSTPGEPWLQVNNVYTYVNVRSKALAEYKRPRQMPFFLMESRYENETPTGTEQRIRVQAYHALLSGAMGQLFGNNPVWHFTGPGIYPVKPANWKLWLDSPGASSMIHLRELFIARAWWMLEPDASNSFLTNGYASADPFNLAAAAKASDNSFAIVYVPNARPVTVDLGQLAGPRVNARWYDPASGAYAATTIPGSPFPISSGSQVLSPPPGKNASSSGSFTDWVLLLESAS